MSKGFFITIEGTDGSGKSTQAKYLRDYFEKKGSDCLFTMEPGGTPIGAKLRELILDRENSEMSPVTEAFLYAADRAQHVNQVIAPALKAGKIVVCDRYIDSSVAYQGFGRRLGNLVGNINEYAVAGCIPDLTFFIATDPGTCKSRIDCRERDRMEEELSDFHRRVYYGYMELARQNPSRIVVIDGTDNMIAIRDLIISEIENRLAENGR